MDWRIAASVGVGVLVGAGLALQAVVNSALARIVGTLEATLISVSVTLAFVIVLLLAGLRSGHLGRVNSVPPYLFIGGFLGAAFLVAAIVLVPRVGAGTLIATVIVGQLVGALLLDQLGVLGLPRIPMTPLRVLGGVLLLLGMRLMLR